MAYSSTVNGSNMQIQLTASETPATGDALSGNPTISHILPGVPFSSAVMLGPASTPAVTMIASGTRTLASGAYTESLEALPGPFASTLNGVGLHLWLLVLSCPATNANPITFTTGGSNGYFVFGATGGSVTLYPGGAVGYYIGATGAQAIGASHLSILATGTGSTDTFNVFYGMG